MKNRSSLLWVFLSILELFQNEFSGFCGDNFHVLNWWILKYNFWNLILCFWHLTCLNLIRGKGDGNNSRKVTKFNLIEMDVSLFLFYLATISSSAQGTRYGGTSNQSWVAVNKTKILHTELSLCPFLNIHRTLSIRSDFQNIVTLSSTV